MAKLERVGLIAHSMGARFSDDESSRPAECAEGESKRLSKTTEKSAKNDGKKREKFPKNSRKIPAEKKNEGSTLGEALAVVAVLAAAYPGKFPLETGKLWSAKMTRFSPDVLHAAAHQMIEECEWPSVAAMIGRCELHQRRARTMGQRLLAAPRVSFDPAAAKALRVVWEQLRAGVITHEDVERVLNEQRRLQSTIELGQGAADQDPCRAVPDPSNQSTDCSSNRCLESNSGQNFGPLWGDHERNPRRKT